jgi:DNA-binding FadR family transcriptional regulator
MTKAGLTLIQSAVVRAVCAERTERDLQALQESFEQASGLPADVAWERKAAAHTEFHNLLADATGNPVFAILVRSMAETLRDIVVMAGPAAEDTITGSRNRLLRHLRARDEENAAAEIEDYLARLGDMRGRATAPRRPRRNRVNSVVLARQLSEPPRLPSAGCSYLYRAQ